MLHNRIDLNLFVVLTTIYQHRSITTAAQALHLTQPAVSHALARLRKKFNDPLFIRHGRSMVPSMFCQQIMPDIQNAIRLLDHTVSSPAQFDIAQHKRQIKMGLRDILETTLFPPLITDLHQNTPNITVHSSQISTAKLAHELEQQHVDIVIDVLTPTPTHIHSQLVCQEGFSLICRAEHPILQQLTLSAYAEATHVLVSLKESRVNAVDMALAQHRLSRNIALQCEHYIAAVSVICHNDMIMTLPNTYADFLRDKFPISVAALPFAVPPLPIHMYWHKQAELDPVNNWLRHKLMGITNSLFN